MTHTRHDWKNTDWYFLSRPVAREVAIAIFELDYEYPKIMNLSARLGRAIDTSFVHHSRVRITFDLSAQMITALEAENKHKAAALLRQAAQADYHITDAA